MGCTRNPEVQKRNAVIYAEWLRGASLTSLGEKYSLARQVVGRIVAAEHPEGEEDEDRAVFRAYMWRLYDEVQDIGDHPGYKMQPNGRPAEDPDGGYAPDANVQVQAKELQLKIIRELRLLDARDKAAKGRLPDDQAKREMEASLAGLAAAITAQKAADEEKHRRELEELRRLRAVVPGEVVAELPPA